MKQRHYHAYFLLLVLLLVLAACAGKQTIDQDPTIQLLADRAAKIEPQALPPLSRKDVQRTYERLTKNTSNDALKAIAMQRLADLALEDKQASLAGEQPAEKPAAVVEQLTRLTGRPALPPLWALGYHQSRWSYHSDDEVRLLRENSGSAASHWMPSTSTSTTWTASASSPGTRGASRCLPRPSPPCMSRESAPSPSWTPE